MKKRKKIPRIQHDGLSRDNREHPLLDPGKVAIDEKTYDELLQFLVALSDKIAFYESDDTQARHSWQAMLLRDETVILALISNYGIQDFADRFFNAYNQVRAQYHLQHKIDRLLEASEVLIQEALLLNKWYEELEQCPHPTQIYQEIENIIAHKLKFHLQTLLSIHANTLEQVRKNVRYAPLTSRARRFSAVWQLHNSAQELSSWSQDDNVISRLLNTLREIFYEFSDSFYHLRKISQALLPASLTHNDHPPHIALLLSFLKIFEHQQQELNQFSIRHLDHYYLDVLNARPRKRKADTAYVLVKPGSHVSEYLLPKNTELLAGVDENKEEIIFSTTEDLLIHQAEVAQVKTLFAGSHPDIYTATYTRLVTKLYAADIIDENKKASDYSSWPSFGEFELNRSSPHSLQTDAFTGFAVSSFLLQMEQGERGALIEFVFSPDSFQRLEQLLAEVASREIVPKREGPAETASEDLEMALQRVMANAFLIEFSSAKGWQKLEDYMISCPYYEEGKTERSLLFHLNIHPEYPGVINFDEALHGQDPRYRFNTPWPVFRFTINPNSPIYPYSFLKCLVLESIRVSVEVKGLRSLDLANQNGPLSSAQAFQPFGNMPAPGSYLLIGHREVFFKKLDSLELDITWQGLPEGRYGFSEYYMGYPEKIVNESFTCKLSILNNHQWLPKEKDEQQELILFLSNKAFIFPPDYSVKNHTPIRYIDTGKILTPHLAEPMQEDLNYTNDLKRGFIKLELDKPAMGFGHEIYPALLSESIIKKSRKADHIVPNKPYTPLISSLTLNYSSSHEINLSMQHGGQQAEGQFFHIQAFGHAEPVRSGNLELLPQFDHEGSLFIGLQNLKAPATLQLFFHLREHMRSTETHMNPPLSWSYLSGNTWKKLGDHQVLKDSTNAMNKSGIVSLEIPSDINDNNSLMPAGFFWIKAEVQQGCIHKADTINVYTNAVSCQRIIAEKNTGDALLAAGSINSLRYKVPEVSLVEQPCPSFNGQAPEQKDHFYLRISERLNHRQRALSPRDYETMVLEKFPFVYKVRCLLQNNGPQKRGGNLNLIVLPDVYSNNSINPFEPRINSGQLTEIKEYLEQYCSGFASLQVSSAELEKIKVSCRVLFSKGCNNGYYVQLLDRAISSYLAPWLDSQERTRIPSFGEKLNMNNILAYMESLSYVERIEDFGINIISAQDEKHQLRTFIKSSMNESDYIISPMSEWAILVSAEKHNVIIDENYESEENLETGINYLSIGADFIINQ